MRSTFATSLPEWTSRIRSEWSHRVTKKGPVGMLPVLTRAGTIMLRPCFSPLFTHSEVLTVLSTSGTEKGMS